MEISTLPSAFFTVALKKEIINRLLIAQRDTTP